MIQRHCKYCGNPISILRHGSAKYCDYSCYYTAKKERANERNAMHRECSKMRLKNRKIFELLYPLFNANVPITKKMLDAYQFDWDYSDEEFDDSDGHEWKEIDGYCYTLLENGNVFIVELEA